VGGIVGKLSFDRHVAISHATVQRMIDALAHRGAAAAHERRATYVGHGIALGSGDDTAPLRPQVAHNETGTVRAVADADLSNAASLRCVLEDRGHLVRHSTDAELIAHAYEEWGDACVERFAGPFAFAIWDDMRRRLVLARDPFGVRPLCFAFDGRSIVFGSRPTPLLQDPAVGREWHAEAIDAYLALGYVPAPFSIYRRVSKLEPAHILVVEGRRLTTRRYWHVSDRAGGETTGRDAIDRLETRLHDSVAAFSHRADPCVLTSGGLASTAVATMLPRGGTAVTIGVDQDPSDLDRMFRIGAHLGLRSEIDIAVLDLAEIVQHVACHFDEPAADPSAVSQYAVFAAARRYTETALTGHGAAALCDSPQGRPVFDEALRHRLYTRRFARQVVDGQAIAGDPGVLSALADSLFAVADRTAAAAGMRLRHPYADRDLAAAPMGALRQLVTPYLPASLLPPARRTRPDPLWLFETVRSLVPHVLLGERFETRGFFSRQALQTLWTEHQVGSQDHTRRFWSLLMLELWVREFIDGDAAAQPAGHAVLVRAA